MRPHLAIPFTTLAATLALAGTAAADIRYAEPGGDGPQATCALADPCSIQNAVGFAVDGETVRLLDGTYTLGSTLGIFDHGVTLEPATPGTRPRIELDDDVNPAVRVAVIGADPQPVTIRGLEIESLSGVSDTDDHPALQLNTPATVRDVVARSRGRVISQGSDDPAATLLEDVRVEQVAGTERAVTLSTSAGPVTARRLTVQAATGGTGIDALGTDLTDSTVGGGAAGVLLREGTTARRLTAAGTQLGAVLDGTATMTDTVATAAGANARAVTVSGQAQLRNVTAIAGGAGSQGITTVAGAATVRNVIARGDALDLKAGPGTLTVDHANFRTAEGITDGGANQSGDPLFVNAAAGDFRLAAGSPAIDAGVADDKVGATDLAGASRFQAAAPDLGAFEATPPAAPLPPVPGGGDSADTTAPAVSGLRGAGKRRGAATARFALGEAATVKVKLERAKAGKRKSGRCVAPTRKLRKAKRCTRFVAVATATRSLPAGDAKVTLGRKIAAGRYRLTVVATDAAGNAAKPVAKRFRIKAR